MINSDNDFLDNVSDIFSNWGLEVVENTLTKNNFLRVGPKPEGNPTAKESLEGQKAIGQSEIVQRDTVASGMLQNGFGFKFSEMTKYSPFLIIGGAAILALLLRRR